VEELIRPSTVLPANRKRITITTSDGLNLIGEVASPLGPRTASLLCLHPNPTGGGMMDSHIYKKAANRLPAMAGIEIIRFNTRGTQSEAGKSEGIFDNGEAEAADVQAAIDFSFDILSVQTLWVIGWSFGTDLALRYAKDPRVAGLILLSPPLRYAKDVDIEFWQNDLRSVTAFIPEHDEYLNPSQAEERFKDFPRLRLVAVAGAKHLWIGEPYVYRILSEITEIITPKALPLPTVVPA
jgi:alpha/beta superfamily hydrolase